MSVETGVNGFGRIGMLYTRAAIDDDETKVVAINNASGSLKSDSDAAHDAAVRLEFDSVHRKFGQHAVEEGESSILVDGQRIRIFRSREPEELPWVEASDRLVVVDSTGANLTRPSLDGHFKSGAKKVVITAPARDDSIPTIVRGVNDDPETLDRVEDVVAVSSCSTNCIGPILKALESGFDLRWGVADIPHAFTSSQKILDGSGTTTIGRRGLTSMIPAPTGSAKEILKLFPDLDFFRSESMRVNIADGSVAMLTVGLMGKLTALDVVEVLTQAQKGEQKGVISLSERGMYLERVLGQPYSSVIDPRVITVDHTVGMSIVKLQAWFDNEWGYANRVSEVANLVGRNL